MTSLTTLKVRLNVVEFIQKINLHLLCKASECLSYHFDDDDFSDIDDFVGGYSDVQPADDYIQSIADEVMKNKQYFAIKTFKVI